MESQADKALQTMTRPAELANRMKARSSTNGPTLGFITAWFIPK